MCNIWGGAHVLTRRGSEAMREAKFEGCNTSSKVQPEVLVSSEKEGSIQERAEAIVMQCNNVDLDFGFFVYIMPVGDNGGGSTSDKW